jgi:hypothetical protein
MWKDMLTATAVDFFEASNAVTPPAPPLSIGEAVAAGALRFMFYMTETASDDSGHRASSSLILRSKTDIPAGAPNYMSFWEVAYQPLPLRNPAIGTYVFEGTILGRRRLGHEIFFRAEFGAAVTPNSLPEHVEPPKKSSDA